MGPAGGMRREACGAWLLRLVFASFELCVGGSEFGLFDEVSFDLLDLEPVSDGLGWKDTSMLGRTFTLVGAIWQVCGAYGEACLAFFGDW